MTTTAIDLLDSIRVHLAEFDLPQMWSVHVVASVSGPNVSVQLARQEPPEIACALLAWADTLAEVIADAWRVPSGDTVHLTVSGLLPGGVPIRVYGVVPFTEHTIGSDLAPDATTTVLLVALRERATVGAVTV